MRRSFAVAAVAQLRRAVLLIFPFAVPVVLVSSVLLLLLGVQPGRRAWCVEGCASGCCLSGLIRR